MRPPFAPPRMSLPRKVEAEAQAVEGAMESYQADLDALGIAIDPELNAKMLGRREGTVSTPESKTAVLVIPTDEEAAIAGDTYELAQ